MDRYGRAQFDMIIKCLWADYDLSKGGKKEKRISLKYRRVNVSECYLYGPR